MWKVFGAHFHDAKTIVLLIPAEDEDLRLYSISKCFLFVITGSDPLDASVIQGHYLPFI